MSEPTSDDRRAYRVPLAAEFQRVLKLCPLISVDAEIMCGAPCIRGTRIPVYVIVDTVRRVGSVGRAPSAHNHRVTREAVEQALEFAASVIECPLEDGE